MGTGVSTALRARAPRFVSRPSRRALAGIAVAAVFGVAIGLAVALSQTTIAIAVALLPLLFVLLLRLEWIPVLVMATVFGGGRSRAA